MEILHLSIYLQSIPGSDHGVFNKWRLTRNWSKTEQNRKIRRLKGNSMWNGKVVSVQTFCVSADYHTSHKIGFRLGEEYPHVLSCILPLPKKTTICVRDLHSVTMAWRTHRSLSSSCEDSTDFSTLDCFSLKFCFIPWIFQFLLIVTCFGS